MSHLQPDRPTSLGLGSYCFFPLQMLLMKRKFFIVDQVERSRHQPLRSTRSLTLTEVKYTPLEGAPMGHESKRSATCKMAAAVKLAGFLLYLRKLSYCWWWRLRDTSTATLTEFEDGSSPLPEVTEVEMFVFLAITPQMWQPHAGQTGILLGNY